MFLDCSNNKNLKLLAVIFYHEFNHTIQDIIAWLKKPSLGMVPIFFVGDKPFLYYAKQIKKEINAGISILASGYQSEQMEFKIGYCGIDQKLRDNQTMDSYKLSTKLRLAAWYSKEFIINPTYLNSSLIDSFVGFYASFFHKLDSINFYNYLEHNSEKIETALKKEYGWYFDNEYGKNQWRMGDGHVGFTNFIYYYLGGFSEYDNLRSNQIREGLITREQGEKLVEQDNVLRIENIDNFCRLIGLNTEEIISKIHRIPALF